MAENYRNVLKSSWCLVAMLMLVLPAPSRAQAPAPSGPEPKIGISISSAGKGVLYRGWPMVMELSITHPAAQLAQLKGEMVAPILLEASSGRWSRFVKLVITNASGALQRWPTQLQTVVGGSIVLTADNSGRLQLVMPATATLDLPVGKYTLQAWLDSRTNATAQSWKGAKTSRIEFEIQQPPFILSDRQQCRKGILSAEYFRILGDLNQEEAALSNALVEAPGELMCIIARGELAAERGELHRAIDLYRLALEKKALVPSDPNGGGSESALLYKCAELVQQLPANEQPRLKPLCAYDRVLVQETEPNDSATEANERMRPNTDVQGELSSVGDADWFTFTTHASGPLGIKLTVPGTADLNWYLYTSSNLETAAVEGTTIHNPELGSYEAPGPGLYFLKVVGNAGATSSYTLEVRGFPIRP